LSVRALSFNQKSPHPISPLDLAGNTCSGSAKRTHSPDFDTKLVFVQKNINNINESVLGYSKV